MARACRMPIVAMALAVGFAAFLSAAAQAQTACGPRADMVRALKETYSEVRRGKGMAGPFLIIELFSSDLIPYSWTILKTTPNGTACIIAWGTLWQADSEPTPLGSPV